MDVIFHDGQRTDLLGTAVGGSIIHQDNLIAVAPFMEEILDLPNQLP